MHLLIQLIVSHIPLRCYSFSSFFFTFCSSNWIISIDKSFVSLILSFTSSSILLSIWQTLLGRLFQLRKYWREGVKQRQPSEPIPLYYAVIEYICIDQSEHTITIHKNKIHISPYPSWHQQATLGMWANVPMVVSKLRSSGRSAVQ